LYLARKIINGKRHFFIRQSYREGDSYLSRDIFDLGKNPDKYIIYPGGNSFYFNEIVTDGIETAGVDASDSELEDIFWRFLKPDIQRALETFRRREKISNPGYRKKDSKHRASDYHIFDRRRIHFLKFGRMDQRGIHRVPVKLFRMLRHKSRDEIEQNFMDLEYVLRPAEYKAYTYVIFNIQNFFSEYFAKDTPQMLNQEKVDEYVIGELCNLNADKTFWDGMDAGDSLHEYLARYACMYFDYEYARKSFMEEYIRNFMNSRRDYLPPYRSRGAALSEASEIFNETQSVLKDMSRSSLTRLYRKRAQQLHPDKGGDNAQFVKLTRAYHKLLKTKS
jgi:hypothetical protein